MKLPLLLRLTLAVEGPFAKVHFCTSRGGFTLKPDAIRCAGREES